MPFLVDFFLASRVLEGKFEGTSDGLSCASLSVALVAVWEVFKSCQALANLAKSLGWYRLVGLIHGLNFHELMALVHFANKLCGLQFRTLVTLYLVIRYSQKQLFSCTATNPQICENLIL